MASDSVVHFVAGGLGGTVGAVVTCPLEVVKTRLQSSCASFNHPALMNAGYTTGVHHAHVMLRPHSTAVGSYANMATLSSPEVALGHAKQRSYNLFHCLRFIVQTEGINGLFKGLGPNLVGVAPSRAIYFFSYANTKAFLNRRWNPDTPIVHIFSAMSAGFTACTITCPIWYVKTRLQLDQKTGTKSLTCKQCILNTLEKYGVKGFYKGISASYFGISETVIHFVLYEHLKIKLSETDFWHEKSLSSDFFRCMLAGAISKSMATSIAYPHEVARTRLREDGSKYRSFFQTLFLVAREDGYRALYRGLSTQLIRQIPNTALMMATYEAVVYLFSCRELAVV